MESLLAVPGFPLAVENIEQIDFDEQSSGRSRRVERRSDFRRFAKSYDCCKLLN